jgi:putative CocE/NonD family hydrolase
MITRRHMLAGTGLLTILLHSNSAGAAPAFPPGVEVIEHVWIPMGDGTRLAARIFRPATALASPVGAVLEYLPYRKRDRYRAYDDKAGTALALAGFALVRVDVRGTGDSDGWINDEYLEIERQDGLAIIAWIARQPWCNGNVGMRGISYGGFTALQAAALRPPALKAIIAACSTENRFADDVHARGGALKTDNLVWGTLWKTILAAPPDPQIAGSGWRDRWLERLQHQQPLASIWTQHRRFDDFWRAGSLIDPAAISCAVYAVGGTVDAYVDAIPRLLETLSCPRKGLITAGAHQWPDGADPGPGLDWMAEEVRWWHYWLAGQDNGIMREPMLHVYMQHAAGPDVYPKDVPGRWVAERAWPSPHVAGRSLTLGKGRLLAGPAPVTRLTQLMAYRARQAVGNANPYAGPTHTPSQLAREQSGDDQRSLLFDSDVLATPIDMLGQARLTLRVAADAPVARVVARITEVHPDGTSWLVALGILNLAQRDSSSAPTPLVPGQSHDVEIPFQFAAHQFQPGNRIRLAISEAYFPYLWPSPGVVTLQVTTGVSQLTLPERAATPDAVMPMRILRDQNAGNGPMRAASLKAGPVIETDVAGIETARLVMDYPFSGRSIPEAGVRIESRAPIMVQVRGDDPAGALFQMAAADRFTYGQQQLEVESSTDMRCTASDFLFVERITARENGQTIFERRWERTVRRDNV